MHLLILQQFAEVFREKLASKFQEISIHAFSNEEDIGDLIKEIDILLAVECSAELIENALNLRWIQAMTSGVDQFINLPSLRKEVLLTTTHGVHGPQMSEMALLLMLALNRNFAQIVRNQAQRVWQRWPATLLYQKKVGILGMGVIGEEISRKCKAFEMTVYGIDPVKRDIDSVDHFHGPEDLISVIQEVDYLVIVAPSTPQTQKMIDGRALSRMKPTAFLISLGRGEVIDEEALIHILNNEEIAGAALDVFATEPLPINSPLWGMKNVIITPHVGGMCDIGIWQIISIFEENLRRFLQGKSQDLINLVEH